MRPELHRFDPATRTDTRFDMTLPEQLGALVPRAAGGFVLAAADGLSFIDSEFSRRVPFVHPARHHARACFIDGKCDRQGRLWAGTTDRLEAEPIGELYRIESDGQAALIASGFIASNGPSFSPNGRIMYHTSSHDRTIYAYDIDPATSIEPASLRTHRSCRRYSRRLDRRCRRLSVVDPLGRLAGNTLCAGRQHRPRYQDAGEDADELRLRR
jgi:sugar lactone lactonase YvrE